MKFCERFTCCVFSVLFLNESRLLEGVQGLLGNMRSELTSEPKLVSVTTPSFGCSRGYHLDRDGEGCGESLCHLTLTSVSVCEWSDQTVISCLRLCFRSRLSRWEFLQGGGVSSVSSGNLSGRRGAGLLQQVSQRLLSCWSVICQSMWDLLHLFTINTLKFHHYEDISAPW